MSDFNKSSSFNAELSSPESPDPTLKRKNDNYMDLEDDVVIPPNKSSKKGDDANMILELLQKISSTQELQSSTLLHIKTKVEKLELENNFKKYDPWKDMAETDRSKTQHLRSKIIPSKVPDVCWLTGPSSSSNKVAHILPDSTPKDVLELLKLPREFRNDLSAKRWNFMILRNDVEEAFDTKKISFVPVDLLHPNEFKLKIWVKDGLTKDVLELEGCKLNVPQGIELCRRALSYQALMAYLTLKYQGKAALDLEEPADFFSEYEGKD